MASEGLARHFDTRHALAVLKSNGQLEGVRSAAAKAMASLTPADHNRLTDRLTALGMMMAPNRPPAEARVWLNEMTRLLGDLPEDILADAIDGLVKTSKFLPTCAEIREVADELRASRARITGQLDAMARYLDSGQPIPTLRTHERPAPKAAEQPMTPAEAEEMNRILAGIGAVTRYRSDGSRYEADTLEKMKAERGPLRKPTRADYIALGVDPAILDRLEA